MNSSGKATKQAGSYDHWLISTDLALRSQTETEVPCDTCTACCRSSQFIRITREEKDTLAKIKPEWLVPAPGQPDVYVLGFDEQGHCPMLADNACSIYTSRPLACRMYDCRIFAAAAIEVEHQPLINATVSTWVFDPPERRRTAVERAASALTEALPSLSPIQLALSAIKVHELFIETAAPDFNEVRRLMDSER